MNLIAAIALLFLDEETTFWYNMFDLVMSGECDNICRFLQAVIEKLLPVGYFTPGLLGAQADQVPSNNTVCCNKV